MTNIVLCKMTKQAQVRNNSKKAEETHTQHYHHFEALLFSKGLFKSFTGGLKIG